MDLSIIIPAYNEEQRLGASLAALASHFATSPRDVEVIVVDDGSSDRTGQLLDSPPVSPSKLSWKMLHNPGNRGKGYSVRRGMLAAAGQRRLFTDADLSAPIAELSRLEAALRAGADVAIGSRRRQMIQHRQSRFRESSGRIFNHIVRLGLGLDFHDTQCGFKLFTAESAGIIFSQQTIEGWGFDPELLFIARRCGLGVAEVPVAWSHAEGAKIHMLRDSLRMFTDVLRIRRNDRRGQYRAPAAEPCLSGPGTRHSGVA